MPLELKNVPKSTWEITKSEAKSKINRFIEEIINTQKDLPKETVENRDFFWFVYEVFTPAFEDYIVEKFKEEKWVDISTVGIDPNDKKIFSEGMKTAFKYYKDFVNDLKSWKIIIQKHAGNRDLEKEMKIFWSLSNENKVRLFKMMYYSTMFINPTYRALAVSVVENAKKDLKNLTKKVK